MTLRNALNQLSKIGEPRFDPAKQTYSARIGQQEVCFSVFDPTDPKCPIGTVRLTDLTSQPCIGVGMEHLSVAVERAQRRAKYAN